MGFFDKRREKDREKLELTTWKHAYIPSYSFVTDKSGNPCGALSMHEGVSTRLPKKPSDFYEGISRFVLVLISSTDKKILGEIDYDKAMKSLEKYIQDDTKEEVLIRELTYQELKDLL